MLDNNISESKLWESVKNNGEEIDIVLIKVR